MATETSATKKLKDRDKKILKKREKVRVSGGTKEIKFLRLRIKFYSLARNIISVNAFFPEPQAKWPPSSIFVLISDHHLHNKRAEEENDGGESEKKIPKFGLQIIFAKRSRFQWHCHVARLRSRNGQPSV